MWKVCCFTRCGPRDPGSSKLSRVCLHGLQGVEGSTRRTYGQMTWTGPCQAVATSANSFGCVFSRDTPFAKIFAIDY